MPGTDFDSVIAKLADRALNRGIASALDGIDPSPELTVALQEVALDYMEALNEEIDVIGSDCQDLGLTPLAFAGSVELAAARQGAAIGRAYLVQNKLAPNAPSTDTKQ